MRGPSVWQFEVKLPDGIPWTELRESISYIESYYNTATESSIRINSSGHSWLSEYQGGSANYTGFVASITKGSDEITLTTSPSTSAGQWKFRAGDFIQLGTSGTVYTVVDGVTYNSNTVKLHREVLENSATGVQLKVGPDVTWPVICTQMPQWTIFARNQVSWNGTFIFTEQL